VAEVVRHAELKMAKHTLSIQQAHELAQRHYQAGRLGEAESLFRQILTYEPSPEAHFNLGKILKDAGRLDEAAAAYRAAIAIRPDLVEAHNNLGTASKEVGDLDGAMAAYRQAYALRPDPRTASNLLYLLWFHPAYDAAQIRDEHLAWGRSIMESLSRTSGATVVPPLPPGEGWGEGRGRGTSHFPSRQSSPGGRGSGAPAKEARLKIGYVSADFRQHVVGYNLLPLFREYDRARFEIHCYSNVARPDSMTAQFQSLASAWRDISALGDVDAAGLIASDRIDILLDLSLHMSGNRLPVFARKPAPVQATFAGYPGTTGLPTIDYRITDPYLDPPENPDEFYSERSIRLPHSFWCYQPLSPEPKVNPLPALTNKFLTFGCLNNPTKLNPNVLSLWAEVMRQTPGSRLLMMARPGSHRDRILGFLDACGVGRDRVRFVDFQPTDAYLRTYHQIDLGLDTFPYNGHTTSLDSLWMGVPVVTLVGRTVVGRAGLSQLSNLGLPELAASEPEDFVRIATALAADLPKLANLRTTLRTRMAHSPFMDAKSFARGIEEAYQRMARTGG
jgi:protein O-GlcNAc transferase